MTIEEEIKSIIIEQLGVAPEDVTRDSAFVEDLNADSLDVSELVMTIEDRYEVDIPVEQAELMRTVGDLIDFVVKITDPSKILEDDSQKKLAATTIDGQLN